MNEPSPKAGFDYATTILALREHYSYSAIAEFCGYENKASISRILAGSIPSHPQGEAIYILYFETFGKKPPLQQNVYLSKPTS